MQMKLNIHKMKNINIVKRIESYEIEYDKWVEYGKPTRTNKEIQDIFQKHCQKCSHYQNGRCDICHCMVNTTTGLNKILWATTSCPDDPAKWVQKKGLERLEATSKPLKNKPDKGCGCG